MVQNLAIASDHAGFELKNYIINNLNDDINLKDFGTDSNESCDFPDFAKDVCNYILNNESFRGLLICGSGVGMSIAANKIKGIRAAVCYNKKSTSLSRQHNNANIIAMGSRITKKGDAIKLVSLFLKTKFEGGRHLRRIRKI